MFIRGIIFRGDGNDQIGLGHLYRLIALSLMYKSDYEIRFVVNETSDHNVIPDCFEVDFLPTNLSYDQEVSWLSYNYPSEEYILVADGYDFGSEYQRYCKKEGYFLMCIDDFAKEHIYADVVINHSLNVRKDDYSAEVYTRFALGGQYAILRPSFIKAASEVREISVIDSCFVCFGGADPNNLTKKAVEALADLDQIKEVNVVVGSAFKHDIEDSSSKVKIYRNLSEEGLLHVMQKCNFSIVSASTISYEVCSVKMPVICGYYVDNQKSLYEGLLLNKVIYGLGNLANYSVENFKKSIQDLISSDKIQTFVENQAILFDSKIKKRFMALITEVSYRYAEEKDLMLIYDWSNEVTVRNNSYNTHSISLEEHKLWFKRKLDSNSSHIYIAEIMGQPAGLVRIDILTEYALIGVSVDVAFRGRRLASRFVRDVSVKYFKNNIKPILAFVKKENLASLHSFEAANFKLLREEKVEGFDSFVYQLTKKDV